MKSFIFACAALVLSIAAAITLTFITEHYLTVIEDNLTVLSNSEGIEKATEEFQKRLPVFSLAIPEGLLSELERELARLSDLPTDLEEFNAEKSRLICLIRQIKRQCGKTLQSVF